MLDQVESVQIRLYESSESDDPISQWSPEVTFDEAISSPRVYRNGKFKMEKRFAELEKFRFADPIGNANVVLAAQDEVGTIPYFIPMRDMDVKIGGNEFDRLRRWYKQGKFRSRAASFASDFRKLLAARDREIDSSGSLAKRAFRSRGPGSRRETRQRQQRRRAIAGSNRLPLPDALSDSPAGPYTTPVAYATAHVAALFIKNFPRDLKGVFAPETLPADTRRAIIAGIRNNKVKITQKITKLKSDDPDDL